MIDLGDAVRRHQRVVVRQRNHPGAELDPLRPLGSGGDHQFGRRAVFIAAGVMFPVPEFLEADFVGELRQFEIALERQCRIFVKRMKRSKEHPGPQFDLTHQHLSLVDSRLLNTICIVMIWSAQRFPSLAFVTAAKMRKYRNKD